MKKIAIIGGGISGLYAASFLEVHCEVHLFEARERLGGRVHTVEGFDLGPSWVWAHQSRILKLIQSLGLEIFPQYQKGHALYETPSIIERFTPQPTAPSGRIKGGIIRIINGLRDSLTSTVMHLGEPVCSISETDDGVSVQSEKGVYRFDKVILTLPPRVILETLHIDPPLPSDIRTMFMGISTWMGHSAKCVIEFESPFWREMGLSGFCFSHAGPMGEIHDACIEGRHALFGFINAHATMKTIEADVRQQCVRLFGSKAERILNFYCVDWRKEQFTSVASDAIAPRSHPSYGVKVEHFGGKLHFVGTETSAEEGGYLEGALASVERLLQTFDMR